MTYGAVVSPSYDSEQLTASGCLAAPSEGPASLQGLQKSPG